MIREFPDVTYIIIGSKERLSKVKSYQIEEGVECLLCPFSALDELPSLLDSKIAELESEVISIIPAGAFPKKLAREQLLHFSKSKYQFWGWYHFGNKFKGALQSIGKLNTFFNVGYDFQNNESVDDVNFIVSLIDEFTGNGDIDPEKGFCKSCC